jgi:hypothetical protein
VGKDELGSFPPQYLDDRIVAFGQDLLAECIVDRCIDQAAHRNMDRAVMFGAGNAQDARFVSEPKDLEQVDQRHIVKSTFKCHSRPSSGSIKHIRGAYFGVGCLAAQLA